VPTPRGATKQTRCPMRAISASDPAATTSPAASRPVIAGNVIEKNFCNSPDRTFQSTGFTLAAWTLTTTSPGAGRGATMRRSRRTSGPPYPSYSTARIPASGSDIAAPIAGAPAPLGLSQIDVLSPIALSAGHITSDSSGGTDHSRARVCGCCGLANTTSIAPCSTISPRYITSTRLHR
jgi:hypothetical protein